MVINYDYINKFAVIKMVIVLYTSLKWNVQEKPPLKKN